MIPTTLLAELRWWNYVPDELFWLALFTAIIVIYFLPTIVAGFTKHPQFVGIAATNAAFGWSGIGFLLCLIWAFRKPSPPVTIIQHTNLPPPVPFEGRPRIEEELSTLSRLQSSGLISAEEYTSRRAKILDTLG